MPERNEFEFAVPILEQPARAGTPQECLALVFSAAARLENLA